MVSLLLTARSQLPFRDPPQLGPPGPSLWSWRDLRVSHNLAVPFVSPSPKTPLTRARSQGLYAVSGYGYLKEVPNQLG